jgi:nitrite reductase/ring-hydroxylating ferredoxin subunit
MYRVAHSGDLPNGGRLHVRVEGRFITLFRHKGRLSAIDAICHHAGGPLTLGRIEDIEELGMSVVLCPWHKFMVSIDGGIKAYQGVDIIKGKPVPSGWKSGKMVQRAHGLEDRDGFLLLTLCDLEEGACTSDTDAKSVLCSKEYDMHGFKVEKV